MTTVVAQLQSWSHFVGQSCGHSHTKLVYSHDQQQPVISGLRWLQNNRSYEREMWITKHAMCTTCWWLQNNRSYEHEMWITKHAMCTTHFWGYVYKWITIPFNYSSWRKPDQLQQQNHQPRRGNLTVNEAERTVTLATVAKRVVHQNISGSENQLTGAMGHVVTLKLHSHEKVKGLPEW